MHRVVLVITHPGRANGCKQHGAHLHLMTLDHVGNQEAMVHATRSLVSSLLRNHTTETSLQPRQGTLSCLSAQPPALAFWTWTRPQVGPRWSAGGVP